MGDIILELNWNWVAFKNIYSCQILLAQHSSSLYSEVGLTNLLEFYVTREIFVYEVLMISAFEKALSTRRWNMDLWMTLYPVRARYFRNVVILSLSEQLSCSIYVYDKNIYPKNFDVTECENDHSSSFFNIFSCRIGN